LLNQPSLSLSISLSLSGVQVLRGATVKAVTDWARLTSDVFIIRCSAADGGSYMNVHSAVVPTRQVTYTSIHQYDTWYIYVQNCTAVHCTLCSKKYSTTSWYRR